jgi:hypothetical protein
MDVEPKLTTITDYVVDRSDGRIGWVVVAVFASAPNVEPRCVDYRVRAVKRATSPVGDPTNAREAVEKMNRATLTIDDLDEFDEFPRAGIPLYVFETASQARLLERLRSWIVEEPERFTDELRANVASARTERGSAPKRGRPPTRSLAEKLAILSDVERAYAEGESRASVAARHHMSDSSLRDLIHWARRVAEPPLLTDVRHGVREAFLTMEARAMLATGVDDAS